MWLLHVCRWVSQDIHLKHVDINQTPNYSNKTLAESLLPYAFLFTVRGVLVQIWIYWGESEICVDEFRLVNI